MRGDMKNNYIGEVIVTLIFLTRMKVRGIRVLPSERKLDRLA